MKWLLCAGLALMAAAHAREEVGPSGQVPHLAPIWSTTDMRTGTPLPSGEVKVNQVKVTWQIGNYWSDGLRIYGLLCTPTSLKPPYPVAILNHGLEFIQTGPTTFIYPAIKSYGLTVAPRWLVTAG